MLVPRTIGTAYGRRMIEPEPMVSVQLTPDEVLAVSRYVTARAYAAEEQGRDDTATRLHWRAAALRESAS